jgi:hypothetical protein
MSNSLTNLSGNRCIGLGVKLAELERRLNPQQEQEEPEDDEYYY